MSLESTFRDPSDFINKVRYETEKSRYVLAIVGLVPLIIGAGWLVVDTGGIAAIYIFISAFLFGVMLWLLGKVVKATLLMNLVEVNNDNFKNIFRMLENAKTTLQYEKQTSAYVYAGSDIGLGILHHLDRKIFLIESAFLEENPSEEVLNFTVMFHVARLKTKSEYFAILTQILSGLEKLWILNVVLYPFERATVYTADRIAMIYSGTSDYAQQAFAREMVGTQLAPRVDINAVANQGLKATGIFAWLARAYSPYPGYAHRFLALNRFSESHTDLMMKRHQP